MPDEVGLVKAGCGLEDEAFKSFESAIDSLGPITNTLISKLVNTNNIPAEAEVEFGLSLKADAGVVITKVSTEANFRVKLRWIHEQSKS